MRTCLEGASGTFAVHRFQFFSMVRPAFYSDAQTRTGCGAFCTSAAAKLPVLNCRPDAEPVLVYAHAAPGRGHTGEAARLRAEARQQRAHLAKQPDAAEAPPAEEQDEEAEEVQEQQGSTEMELLRAALLAAALKSGDSLDEEYEASGEQPPGVCALAVLRLAADDEEQRTKLYQLLDPRMQELLSDLRVLEDAVSVHHYTSAHACLIVVPHVKTCSCPVACVACCMQACRYKMMYFFIASAAANTGWRG
jgi:hypothetical protein